MAFLDGLLQSQPREGLLGGSSTLSKRKRGREMVQFNCIARSFSRPLPFFLQGLATDGKFKHLRRVLVLAGLVGRESVPGLHWKAEGGDGQRQRGEVFERHVERVNVKGCRGEESRSKWHLTPINLYSTACYTIQEACASVQILAWEIEGCRLCRSS